MLYEHALSINRSENEPPEPILFKDASEYAIILSFNHYCVAKMSSIWSGSLVKHRSQVSLIFPIQIRWTLNAKETLPLLIFFIIERAQFQRMNSRRSSNSRKSMNSRRSRRQQSIINQPSVMGILSSNKKVELDEDSAVTRV